MENHPSRHRGLKSEKNHAESECDQVDSGKKNFATFLIELGFPPLVMVGRCMRFFGMGVVVAFVSGAALLYGYSVFRIVPGSKAAAVREITLPAPSPAPPKTVWLHGTVKSETQFEIGVLAIRRGPFRPDGSYAIQAPESDRYLVICWYPDYSRFKMQDMSPDSSGTLPELVFPPSNLAKREDPANHLRSGALDDSALAANQKSRGKDVGVGLKNSLLGGSK